MATTTKSTKAKTKTSKAKTTKPKTTATKVTKKSTAAKTVKPTIVVKTTPKQNTVSAGSMTLLQKIYAASIGIYVAIAAAAYMLMSEASVQLSVGYLAKDELKSVNGTQFAPATQGIVDVQIRWIVMAVALLSIIVPALYLTRLKAYHAKALKEKVLMTRWIDMAIVAAIMLETVAVLSGVFDIGTLKLIGGLMVVTMILGWMAEKRTAEAGKPATAKYYLSMVTGLLPWVTIAMYALFTYTIGTLRSPWYVYALYVVLLGAGGVIGNYQLKSLKAEGELKNYDLVERNYAALSLVTRTAFAAILIIGLMAK